MRQWFAVLNSGLSGRHVNNILFAQSLHTTLLYTDEKQDFDIALETFEQISARLAEIGE